MIYSVLAEGSDPFEPDQKRFFLGTDGTAARNVYDNLVFLREQENDNVDWIYEINLIAEKDGAGIEDGPTDLRRWRQGQGDFDMTDLPMST